MILAYVHVFEKPVFARSVQKSFDYNLSHIRQPQRIRDSMQVFLIRSKIRRCMIWHHGGVFLL